MGEEPKEIGKKNRCVWSENNFYRYPFQFDALSHGERIERLFLALHLLTYLLENDFAMWMIKLVRLVVIVCAVRILMISAHFPRYSDCLHETMQQSNATPLIVSVLWSKSEPRQVNNFIKQILRIFVSCVNIDASAERVAILSVNYWVHFNLMKK